jgi:SpoIID/LytB domain protein
MGDLVKNSSGYVLSMRIGNSTITGMKLQENVLAGFSGRAIRSAAFDISYNDGTFSITTYGYGHGCGMSQYGAWGYAANGWSYAQILAHYYPGTTLSTIG